MDGLGERLDAAVVGLERHRADAVGPVAQFLCAKACPHGKRAHVLRAIEQCQAFLAGQVDGFPALGLEHLSPGDDLTVHLHLAQTDQRQAQVCQRHQVARGTQRALAVDDGADALVEEVNQSLHGVEFAARVAVTERLHLEQEHDAHNLVGHALAHAAGMRLHQVDLQLRQLVLAHAHLAQRAEACGHAIDGHGAVGDFLVQVLAATHNALAGIIAEPQLHVFLDNFADTLQREMLGTDFMNHNGYVN